MAVVMADTAAADGTRTRPRIARIYTDRAIKDELKELRFRSRLFVFWDVFWFIYLSTATSRIGILHG
jgi:hypothetical protein